MDGVLFDAFIYLCAAVIAVPVANRLGLGSVLGYLIAGIVIGPVLGLVGAETQALQHFAELGVVMMLFLVGLELEPRTLWRMRARLFGLGGLQVVASAALIAVGALAFGLAWPVALAVGLIFSLSSTAIVVQTLNEKGLMQTEGGRASFSVLLFQDIAVIPMLAMIPLLVVPDLAGSGVEVTAQEAVPGPEHAEHGDPAAHGGSLSLVAGLPGWAHGLVVLGAVATVLLGGHFLSRPLFRFIADSRLREIFTAAALLLVIGIALLMTLVDLSPALGTFLAGVVLADSEFRHELETDIEPFKGLLLGLFFITVGAGIDFGLLWEHFLAIIALTLSVILLKGAVLYGLARLFRLRTGDGWLLTLSLAQAGEFGFVLLSFALQNGVIAPDLAKLLALVVALSMLLTPALFILYERRILPRLGYPDSSQEPDQIDEQGTVIIAGSGRFGLTINRLLVASGVRTVVLDHEAARIETLRGVGIKSYYGDATRSDLLRTAGIAEADLFICAIDDRDRAVELVEQVRRHYPGVRILARAFDVNHLYLLRQAGADLAVREVFDASLTIGTEALRRLGIHPYKVRKMVSAFRQHDAQGLEQIFAVWDENPEVARNKAFLARITERSDLLTEMMQADRLQLHDRTERGWTPPPKGYAKDQEG